MMRCLCLLLLSLFCAVPEMLCAEDARPSLSEPAISPDSREIAFVSGGDIWTVPAEGGEAHLLISHPATEERPLYSPDGTRLAFISTRTEGGSIYVLTLKTGQLLRVTYTDAFDRLDAWSKDGRWLYFTSSVNDVAGMGDIFRVSAEGGTPLEVSHERYMNEFEASPSPDGMTIALMAKGISDSQWWRNGHSHIDNTELWLKPVAEASPYRRLLADDAKHAWPMWSADGKTLFYMSDASGAENLWTLPSSATDGKEARELTHFKDGRLLWPTISADGRTIVFERGMAIWRADVATGKATEVPIALRGLPATPGVTHLNETHFSQMSVSPDGNKVAVIAHGEVFAASAKDGGEARRITHTAAAEGEPRWAPDSTRLLYLSERSGQRQLFLYDFASGQEAELSAPRADISAPRWSPDGKMVAYVANSKELHRLVIPEAKAMAAKGAKPAIEDRVLASGLIDNGTSVAWSPDSQWIAFTMTDHRAFSNVHVVLAGGGEEHPVTFLANGQTGSEIAWSPDGHFLLFDTTQRSEQGQIARVDLLPHTPKYREDEFRELFQPSKPPGTPSDTPTTPKSTPTQPATPAQSPKSDPTEVKPASPAPAGDPKAAAAGTPAPAKDDKKPEPVKIVFEGLRERLTMLPLGLSAGGPVISPDGKLLVFSASVANQASLYTFPLDELAKEPAIVRQLTSSPGSKDGYSFTADSKSVFYLENGEVRSIDVESRGVKPVGLVAPMDVDFDQEKNVVFQQAWSTLDRTFFDPKFNGHDWKRLHDVFAPYAAGARTGDELTRDINLMIGELNASHSGMYPASALNAAPPRIGDLGLRFDREAYEAGKGLVVREVIALGPAAVEGTIRPGDRLLSVNGEAIGPHTNLDALLQDAIDHRVTLGMERNGARRDATVRPVAPSTAMGLLYRQWVSERRAYVERISGGKIGYVHIAAMGDESLQQLYLDLDAQNEAKQGVVVDVRNNDGGYVNGYVLDVFTRRNYLEMTPRDQFPMPSRQALGQRALGLPTVLVTNESTLSDGEDFTEGYRTLKLGKVVGTPTAGWIIFTDGVRLLDGSGLRTPEIRIRDLEGRDMEMHPRPVDVEVERMLGEGTAGKDAQLDRAVEQLLGGH